MESGNSYFGGNLSFILTNTCYVMVWYWMIWYGVVLYDVIWYGVVYCGMLWYGIV